MSRTRFIMMVLMMILVPSLCIILPACQTKVIGLVKDPSFTYEAITAGKMAIGGVTSALGSMSDAERNHYSDVMRMMLLMEQETLIIFPAGIVAHFLGHADYRNMLDEYRNYGRLSDMMKQKLITNFKEAQYIVFARIERDYISKNRIDVMEDEYGKELENKKTIMEVTRSTDVSFNIYDLRTGAIVWSGTLEGYSSRKNEYIDKKKSKFFLIALIDCILESRPEYPEPSSLDVLLRLIFTSFAKNLPKEE